MIMRMSGRRRIFAFLVMGGIGSLVAATVLVGSALGGSSRRNLLQSKRGSEYILAMARFRLRDPVRDGREDLLGDNHDLYCVGTYACWPPGLEERLPDQMTVRATAATGGVIAGGALEMAYRREEERYVAAYNQAKLKAFRSGGPAAVRGGH